MPLPPMASSGEDRVCFMNHFLFPTGPWGVYLPFSLHHGDDSLGVKGRMGEKRILYPTCGKREVMRVLYTRWRDLVIHKERWRDVLIGLLCRNFLPFLLGKKVMCPNISTCWHLWLLKNRRNQVKQASGVTSSASLLTWHWCRSSSRFRARNILLSFFLCSHPCHVFLFPPYVQKETSIRLEEKILHLITAY